MVKQECPHVDLTLNHKTKKAQQTANGMMEARGRVLLPAQILHLHVFVVAAS